MNLIDLPKLKKRIVSFDNVLIVAHIDPDPDTLGSALGLKKIFEKLGKTSYVACDTAVSGRICSFFEISPNLDLEFIKAPDFAPERIICVDAAAISQIGAYGKYYSEDFSKNKIDLVIDHHYTNSLYGKENYIDEKASATGEIIYDLALECGVEIDPGFAKDVYCAIICDSGSFGYSSTTPKTMATASKLMETGFDFAKLNRLVFQTKTKTQIAMERLAYNSLKFYAGGKIAVIAITNEAKKNAGLEGAEIEGINEIARTAEGVEVGATIKETEMKENQEAKEFKISLRSNEYANVAKIAEQYGGGGHMKAAGCKVSGYCEAEILERELVEKITGIL
ncbi:MAG: bifunctional oligoribonuclease/PAP phosphatase NrnA [Oscillospiraceae bacterium]|nr:bifunctional oligoribonuclease/PAP phosphatase NrnA [Oscillospiraceae bacterium]